MSAGMAGIIAAHGLSSSSETEHARQWMCQCGQFKAVLGYEAEEPEPHATHLAEELAKAGYGNVQTALLTAADEMPFETLGRADKASIWLRQRAHSLDPEGRALVKAIHERKAEGWFP